MNAQRCERDKTYVTHFDYEGEWEEVLVTACPPHAAVLRSAAERRSPVAATDETATKIATSAIQSLSRYDGRNSAEIAAAVVAALEANGYALVPRKELDGLLSAALDVIVVSKNNPSLERLAGAHHDVEAAVVEAVGPTP